MKKFSIENYISHLSIDCVIFGYKDKALKVLICKFKYGKDLWGLPGGYILKTEGIDKAASRILKERTALDNLYLEQFRVFGDENRIINSDSRQMIKSGLTKYNKQLFDVIDNYDDQILAQGVKTQAILMVFAFNESAPPSIWVNKG